MSALLSLRVCLYVHDGWCSVCVRAGAKKWRSHRWISRMSEQQSAPEQLAAGKSQGGAGATYKVRGQERCSVAQVCVSICDAGTS